MLFRLVRPMFRDGSHNAYFNQRIPGDVLAQARGMKLTVPCGERTISFTIGERATHIKFSLCTRDASEVKARQAQAAAHVANVWKALRESEPVPLTHRQAVALSGELYRSWAHGEGRERVTAIVQDPQTKQWERDDEPQEAERVAEWEAAAVSVSRMGDERHVLETALGPIADRLLLAKGIGRVDRGTRAIILTEFRRALVDAIKARRRNAEGDYSPKANAKAERFPEWIPNVAKVADTKLRGRDTLTALFEAWRREAERRDLSHSTIRNYGGVVRRFIAFLKYDDALRVTPEDVLRFKDHRLERGIAAKTIKDIDLTALKSFFAWAVENRRLPSNPAAGITLRIAKKKRTRSNSPLTKSFLSDSMRP